MKKISIKKEGKMLIMRYLIFISIGILCFNTLVGAKTKWVVDVKEAPPFVIIDKNTSRLSGFSIDIIKEIAMVIDDPVDIDFTISPNLETHLNKVINDEVDLGIAATSITVDRSNKMDFSFPFFKSKLGILIKKEKASSIWKVIFSKKIFYVFIGLVIYIFICGNLIWILEHGESSFNDKWIKGVFEGVWWTIVTMSTVGYGDFVPRRALSRLMASIMIFSGIIIFSIAIGAFSSLMTISHLESDSKKLSDLSKKRVSCIVNTTSCKAVDEKGAIIVEAKNLEEAISNLNSEKVVAMVYDSHLLLYHLNKTKNNNFDLVDNSFRDEHYGVGFPLNSKIRKQVNIGLLRIMKDSRYKRIYEKWFQ